MPIVRKPTPKSADAPFVAQPARAPVPTGMQGDLAMKMVESNERLVLAIKQAAETNSRKVVTATVERDKEGLISKIRMEVESI